MTDGELAGLRTARRRPADALGAVQVPASTANLGPAYDAAGAALSLHTIVTAVPAASRDARVTTALVGPAAGRAGSDVPDDERNLVWQGVEHACDAFGWDVPDVALEVRAAIPMASGLGSSSAAIVGGMAIARLLAGADASVVAGPAVRSPDGTAPVGDRALVEVATAVEGHPDNVAPAIHGGLVVAATGDDGGLVVRMAPPPATLDVVVLLPDRTSSTETARGIVPDTLSRADVVAQSARTGHVVGSLLGAWPADARAVGDRLHEPPRTAELGAGGDLLPRLRTHGHHAWLSGAGPALAVTVPSRLAQLPDTLVEAAEAAGHAVLRLTWDRQGVRPCVPDGCGVAGAPTCLDCPLGSVR